jgi:hypothetical protein
MRDCERSKVEKSKALLKSGNIHEAVIVLSTADIAARRSELFVLMSRVTLAAPFRVWREKPTVSLTFCSKS